MCKYRTARDLLFFRPAWAGGANVWAINVIRKRNVFFQKKKKSLQKTPTNSQLTYYLGGVGGNGKE